MYVEDLKRGTNKDIGPKDIFEMGSNYSGGGLTSASPVMMLSPFWLENRVSSRTRFFALMISKTFLDGFQRS